MGEEVCVVDTKGMRPELEGDDIIMLMEILIGTKNPYKVKVLEDMVKDISGVSVYFLKDTLINLDIEENKTTLLGNAIKKAVTISKYTDKYVLTSDGGVDIPSLGDKWDILRNQRIVGHDNKDIDKVHILLSLMKGLKGEERRVEHHLAIALARNGKEIFSFEDITDRGYITDTLVDENIPEGRWMGHVWYYPEFKKVNTKLNDRENKVVLEQGNNMKEQLSISVKKIILHE